MKEKLKKNRFYIIFTVILFVLLNYLMFYFRVTFSNNFLMGFNYLFEQPKYLLYAFPLSFNVIDLAVSLFGSFVAAFMLHQKRNNQKNFRRGEEHGSAKWGNPRKDLEGMYNKENQFQNIIFSENVKMALDNSSLDFKNQRNKNVCVLGGSGSGKTRFFVKPNLLQMNASFVVTDPKGTIVNELGMVLKNKGNYKIKILNTVNFKRSMRYNPLAYIEKEEDILKVVETIIANTNGGDKKEDFWLKAERLLYQSYLSLIISRFPEDEKNLGTLMDLISYSTVKEDNENFKNAIDYLFDELEKEEPNHFALKQYKAYKLAAGKTAKSILISCATRLAPINIPAVRELLSTDELDLRTLGDKGRKTALFIIVPDTDSTFNFIVSIMYSQLFNLLATVADERYKGRLPTHVRFLLDEFANIGLIPNFEKLVATIRSREMSATIILQTISQLKAIYKDSADTIIGNCDTMVFLGGKEKSTVKSISEDLGKETINDTNESITRSNHDSYALNHIKVARALMTEDELQTMPRDTCIVQIIGKHPFKDKKYNLTKHPRYKFHADGDKYWFDIDQYIKTLRQTSTENQISAPNKVKKQDYRETIDARDTRDTNDINEIKDAESLDKTSLIMTTLDGSISLN